MFGDPFEEFQQDPFFDFRHQHQPGQQQQQQQQYHNHHHRRHRHSGGRPHSLPRSPEHLQLEPRGLRAGARDHGLAAMRPWESGPLLPGFSFGPPARLDRLFDDVTRMMADAGGRLRDAEEASKREKFDGQLYSHSAVFAYSSDGPGSEPRVFQAVSETRAGPGGVRETRKALKDSRTREEKVSVGRHIGGRGHTVQRRLDGGTGQRQEDHHFIGIDESEGAQFDREWDARAAGTGIAGGPRHRRLHQGGGGWGGRRAITDGRGT